MEIYLRCQVVMRASAAACGSNQNVGGDEGWRRTWSWCAGGFCGSSRAAGQVWGRGALAQCAPCGSEASKVYRRIGLEVNTA